MPPSSQASVPTLSPSPQIDVHVVNVKAVLLVQSKPASNCHVLEHPSLLAVLPFSHCSLGVMYPSPHCSVQVEAVEDVPPEQ